MHHAVRIDYRLSSGKSETLVVEPTELGMDELGQNLWDMIREIEHERNPEACQITIQLVPPTRP